MNIPEIAAQHGISQDEVRRRWLALRVALWKQDFRKFAREVCKIRTMEGDLSPLILNESQLVVHNAAEKQLKEENWVRLLCLKGRRQGFSTYVAARGYWRAILYERQNIYLLSHEMASSNLLFDMVALMQEKNPFPPEVGTDNAKTLEFRKLGSSYSVATAGQKAGGRGAAVSYFHGSEVSRWTNAEDHFSSSVQAVDEVKGVWGVIWVQPSNPLPFECNIDKIESWIKPPSEIFLETTSAGPIGSFYNKFMEALKGIGRYRTAFAPWTMRSVPPQFDEWIASEEAEEEGELSEAEYQRAHNLSDAQMLWRRSKIHELGSIGKFRQEYPIDVTEAFAAADTDGVFIPPALVLKARKRRMDDPDAPLVLGVDPAGAGGDRFAVAARRGDKCLWVRHRNRLEHDDAVAWLASLIDEEKPQRMCIDRGSMGQNIISSLRNQNPKYATIVKGIDFGAKSKAKTVNPTRAGPWNARAEIYGRMRDWLLEGGAIPDDDDLASDMSAPKTKYRANNDWLLESKSDLKARGMRSTDLSDALALTFSVQEFFHEWNSPPVAKTEGSWDIASEFSRDTFSGVETGWMA